MRRLIAVPAVVGICLVATSVGGAKTRHNLSATIRSAQVATQGQVLIQAGRVTGGLGEGATIARITPRSATQATVRFKTWYQRGTFSGTATFTNTPRLTGGSDFTGSGRFTGGTGKFAGARGTFTSRGSIGTDGVSVQQITGTLIY